MTGVERRGNPGAVLLAVLLCAGSPPTAATAQDDDPEYTHILEEAVAEYGASHFEEAHALFMQAHEMHPTARTFRGLGMVRFELRQYVAALRALDSALASEERPLTPQLREEVEALRLRTLAFVGRVRVRVEPEEAVLLVDGVDPEREEDGSLLLDAGEHTLAAECPGCTTGQIPVRVQGGDEMEVTVHATPPEPPAPPPPPPEVAPPPPVFIHVRSGPPVGPLVTLLAGGALVIAAIPTGVLALGAESDLDAACPSGVCSVEYRDTRDRANRLSIVTDVLWATGAAVMGAAVVWWLATREQVGEHPVTAGVACVPGACGLVMRGTL